MNSVRSAATAAHCRCPFSYPFSTMMKQKKREERIQCNFCFRLPLLLHALFRPVITVYVFQSLLISLKIHGSRSGAFSRFSLYIHLISFTTSKLSCTHLIFMDNLTATAVAASAYLISSHFFLPLSHLFNASTHIQHLASAKIGRGQSSHYPHQPRIISRTVMSSKW